MKGRRDAMGESKSGEALLKGRRGGRDLSQIEPSSLMPCIFGFMRIRSVRGRSKI